LEELKGITKHNKELDKENRVLKKQKKEQEIVFTQQERTGA
jgi:CRISPR/Cas system CMR subunit Cmr6 (Cas7 group RAMP superfamily)